MSHTVVPQGLVEIEKSISVTSAITVLSAMARQGRGNVVLFLDGQGLN